MSICVFHAWNVEWKCKKYIYKSLFRRWVSKWVKLSVMFCLTQSHRMSESSDTHVMDSKHAQSVWAWSEHIYIHGSHKHNVCRLIGIEGAFRHTSHQNSKWKYFNCAWSKSGRVKGSKKCSFGLNEHSDRCIIKKANENMPILQLPSKFKLDLTYKVVFY